MVGRLIPVDGPKLEAEIQAVLADVRALVAENVRLRDAIRKAAPTVCSMLCPSQWRTGARPPHHPDCEAITAALAGKATVKESVTVEVCRCDRDDNGTWRGTCKCAKSVAESTRLGWLDAANFLETLGQFSYARALRREAGVVEIENG